MNFEYMSVFFSLLKTVVGGAINEYPRLFHTYGVIPTLSFEVLSVIFAVCGLFVYMELNKQSDYKANVSTFSEHSIPLMKYFVDIVMIFKCFFVITIYLKMINSVLNTIIDVFFGSTSSKLVLFVLVAIVTPLFFVKNMNSFRFASIFGVISIYMMIFSVAWRYLKAETVENLQWTTKEHNYLKDIGTFVFGFSCHINILSVQAELKSITSSHLRYIVIAVMVFALGIYSLFGIFVNFLISSPTEEFLKLPMNDNLSLFVKGLYGLSLTLTIFHQLHPCRFYALSMVNPKFAEEDNYWLVRWIFTTFTMLFSYVIVLRNVETSFLFNVVGGIFSALINFVFPGMFYLFYKGLRKNNKYRIISGLLVSYGIFSIGFVFKNWLMTSPKA